MHVNLLRWTGGAVCVALVAAGLAVIPSQASSAAAAPGGVGAPSVPSESVRSSAPLPDEASANAVVPPAAAVVPAPGSWSIASGGAAARSAGAPSWLSVGPAAPLGSSSSTVAGRVLPTSVSAGAGAGAAFAFTVDTVDPVWAASASMSIDYSGFRDLHGGGYADRLRLVRYPGCLATTPWVAACRVATVVPTRHDRTANRLTARVSLTDQVPAVEPAVPTPPTAGSPGAPTAGVSPAQKAHSPEADPFQAF